MGIGIKEAPKTKRPIVPANETPRIELLERDVYIQFCEIRKLRAELAETKAELKKAKNELLYMSYLHQ